MTKIQHALTILITVLSNTVWGQLNLVGQYSALGPHGTDFLFKTDSTFEIRWHSDLVVNGKSSGTEYKDSLAFWRVKDSKIYLRMPNNHRENTSDTIFEILNDNVIKRVGSDQKWFKTKLYDENGNLTVEFNLLSVDPDLKFKDYNYNEYRGKRIIQYQVRNGLKQNDEMELLENDNGKKTITVWGQWDKGLKIGTWTYSDNEGQALRDEFWRKGKEHGQWKIYNSGQLKIIKTYNNGVLKSTKEL